MADYIADQQSALAAIRDFSSRLEAHNVILSEFITTDAACIKLKQEAALLSPLRDLARVILITGQSGAGKEIIARAMHCVSFTAKPFVAVNVSSLPDTLYQSLLFGHVKGTFTGAYEDKQGAFAAAADGTLFLDEIGDMPLTQQASLLRALETFTFSPVGGFETYPINCRVVAATNVDLSLAVAEGKFRPDLYARLFTYHLSIPPLSARAEDRRLIAEHYGLPPTIAGRLAAGYCADELAKYGVRFIKAIAARYKLFQTTGMFDLDRPTEG